MSLDADLIVDRRRMRRKLTFWRVLAIALIVLAIAGAAAAGSNRARLHRRAALYRARHHPGLIRGDRGPRAGSSTGSRDRRWRAP